MEDQKSYVYDGKNDRPSKQRRLIVEDDLSSTIEFRKHEFERQWHAILEEIEAVMSDANANVLGELEQFVTEGEVGAEERLSVGLVSSAYGSVESSSLFQRLGDRVSDYGLGFACVQATDCANLKSALKFIITSTSKQGSTGGDYGADELRRLERTPLQNYDLRLLQRWCNVHSVKQILVTIPEAESLDAGLLSNLVSQLHSWRDRIRFTLLLGIGSSFALFSDRLPRTLTRSIRWRQFTLQSSESLTDQTLETCLTGQSAKIFPGPSLSDTLTSRQRQQITTIDSFVASLKYAYMSHFTGNALSVFLIDNGEHRGINDAHFEAIRELPSFRRHAEELMSDKKHSLVKQLLDSNQILEQYVRQQIDVVRSKIAWVFGTLRAIRAMQAKVGLSPTGFSSLYVRAFAGDLSGSRLMKELMIRIRVSEMSVLINILSIVRETLITMPPADLDISPDTFDDLSMQLDELSEKSEVQAAVDQTPRFKSKSKSNKQAGKPSGQNAGCLQACYEAIEDYFNQTLELFGELFPREILFYDLKIPHRDAFTPRIRFGIERALTNPHDYLGCECCAHAKESLSPSQPPTSILYQLYLESGALINLHDLLSAFQAVMEEHYQDEQLVKAMFFRGLAELKMMGFIKPSRKKMDHIAKLGWKGL